MTVKQVELSLREFNKIVKSGKVLRTSTKNGQIFAEFNTRGANPLWMKELAKMRGVKQANESVRLRDRIEMTPVNIPSNAMTH